MAWVHGLERVNFERRLRNESLLAARPCIASVIMTSTSFSLPQPAAVKEPPPAVPLVSPRRSDFATAFAAAPPLAYTPRMTRGSANSPRHFSHFSIGSSPLMKPGVPTGRWAEPTKSGGGAWGLEELASRRYSTSMHGDDKKGTENEGVAHPDGLPKQQDPARGTLIHNIWAF